MNRNLGRLGVLILTLVVSIGLSLATPIPPIAGCRPLEVLARAQRELQLEPIADEELHAVVVERLLPVVGSGVFLIDPTQVGSCSGNLGCFALSGFGTGLDLRVQMEAASAERIPWVTFADDGTRTLHVPRGTRWASLPRLGRDLIQRFLIGHPLHPLNANSEAAAVRSRHGERGFILKDAQREAVQAAEWLMRHPEHARRMLLVAPTGFGKSEILKFVLTARLQAPSARGLFLLVADQIMAVSQLTSAMHELRTNGVRFGLLQWGADGDSILRLPDGTEQPITGLEALRSVLDASSFPIVLTATRSILASRFGIPPEDSDRAEDSGQSPDEEAPAEEPVRRLGREVQVRFDRLRPYVHFLAYDEAHHAGAYQASEIIQSLTGTDSNAFLFGMTATPLHRSRRLASIFGPMFFAYLDTVQTFIARLRAGTGDMPSVARVIDQLSHAILSGELTPIGEVRFVPGDLYEVDAQGRLVPKLSLRPRIVRTHRAPILAGRAAFASYPSIASVKVMKPVYEQYIPELTGKVEVLHSELSGTEQRRVQQRIERGEVKLVLAVAQMDEAVNSPELDTYLDMNPNVGPKRILQRMGRILRLFEGKRFTRIYMAMAVDEHSLRDSILLFEAIRAGRLGTVVHGGGRPSADDSTALPIDSEVDTLPLQSVEELETEVRAFWGQSARQSLESEFIDWMIRHDGTVPRHQGIEEGESWLYQRVRARLRLPIEADAFRTAIERLIESQRSGSESAYLTPRVIAAIQVEVGIVDPLVSELVQFFRNYGGGPLTFSGTRPGESTLYTKVGRRVSLANEATQFRQLTDAYVASIQSGPQAERLNVDQIIGIRVAVKAIDPVALELLQFIRDHSGEGPTRRGTADGEFSLYRRVFVRLADSESAAFLRNSMRQVIELIQTGPDQGRLTTPQFIGIVAALDGIDPAAAVLVRFVLRTNGVSPRRHGSGEGEDSLSTIINVRLRDPVKASFLVRSVEQLIGSIQRAPSIRVLTQSEIDALRIAIGLIDPTAAELVSFVRAHGGDTPRPRGVRPGERLLYQNIGTRLRDPQKRIAFTRAVEDLLALIERGPYTEPLSEAMIRAVRASIAGRS